jgi:hypothetical protein
VKRFDTRIRTEGFIGQPFKDNGIPRMLEDFIRIVAWGILITRILTKGRKFHCLMDLETSLRNNW